MFIFPFNYVKTFFTVTQITFFTAQPNLLLMLDSAATARAFFSGFTDHVSWLLSNSLLWCFILRPQNHLCPWHDPDIHILYEKDFSFMPAIKIDHWKTYNLRPHNNQAHYFPAPAFCRCSERWCRHEPLLLFWNKRLFSAPPSASGHLLPSAARVTGH